MKSRTKERILTAAALVCNLLTVLMVAQSLLHFFIRTGDGNMTVHGVECFIYFTVDSNVLAALFCLVSIPYNIRKLLRGTGEYPLWLKLGCFAGTAAVSVTFWTVIIFLGPIYGYDMMYVGINLPLHLLCPLMVFFTFVLFQNGKEFRFPLTLLGLLPTLLYGAVYLRQVVLLGVERGGWKDFYHFNAGGRWYISIIAMSLATYLISVGVYFAHRLCSFLLRGRQKAS